jgi:HK97 family phage major capsid protein
VPRLNDEDQELVNALRVTLNEVFDEKFDQRMAPMQKQVKGLMERASRPPGSALEHASLDPVMSLSRQLLDDGGFQAFTKSVMTSKSSYATEVRLPLSRKAATPVSGISPTEYLPQRIWGAAQFPLRLREIMPVLPVTSGTIEYTQETSFTPSAAIVPETTVKPAMGITFTEATAKCATIASIVKVSKQSLADVALMNTWLNVRLGYSVNLKEEDTIINGDATNSIQGLMQLATPFTYAPATGDTGMDVIAHAIGSLMGKGYAVDGLIVNADDYTAMRLLKTTVGGYIFVGTASTGPDDESVLESPMKIWEIPTIISPSMAPGQFIIGAFTQSTILFSREVLTIEIAFQNENDFVRNLVCLRGELRSGLAVPVPAGVLKGTLPAGSLAAHNTHTANGPKK